MKTKNKEQTIKYLEQLKKKAEKLVRKHFEYCKVCGKKLAEWVQNPDGEGSFNTSLKDIKNDKYEIYQANDGSFVFACWNCSPKNTL